MRSAGFKALACRVAALVLNELQIKQAQLHALRMAMLA